LCICFGQDMVCDDVQPAHEKVFMRRYWYMSPVKEIAADYGMGESKVKMSLLRSRNELKHQLGKEGISI